MHKRLAINLCIICCFLFLSGQSFSQERHLLRDSGVMGRDRGGQNARPQPTAERAFFSVYGPIQLPSVIGEFDTWKSQIERNSPGYFAAVQARALPLITTKNDENSKEFNVRLEQLRKVTLSMPRWVVLRRENVEWYIPEFLFAEKISTRMSPQKNDALTAIQIEEPTVTAESAEPSKPIVLRLQLPFDRTFQAQWKTALQEAEEAASSASDDSTTVGLQTRLADTETLLDAISIDEYASKHPSFKTYKSALQSGQGEVFVISRRVKSSAFLQRMIVPTYSNTVFSVSNRNFLNLYKVTFGGGEQIVMTRINELPILSAPSELAQIDKKKTTDPGNEFCDRIKSGVRRVVMPQNR